MTLAAFKIDAKKLLGVEVSVVTPNALSANFRGDVLQQAKALGTTPARKGSKTTEGTSKWNLAAATHRSAYIFQAGFSMLSQGHGQSGNHRQAAGD